MNGRFAIVSMVHNAPNTTWYTWVGVAWAEPVLERMCIWFFFTWQHQSYHITILHSRDVFISNHLNMNSGKTIQANCCYAGVAHWYIYDSQYCQYIYIYTHTACLPPFLGCILSDPYSCRLCCINRCERSFMTSECLGIIGMRHCSPCFGSWCWLSWPFMCLGLSWQDPAPGNQFLGGIMKLLWWLATIIMTAATSTSPSWKDLCLKRYPILLPVTRSMSGQGMCFGDDQPHRPQMRFDLPSRKGIPFHLVALAIPGYSYSILL